MTDTVEAVADLAEAGWTWADVLWQWPWLDRADVLLGMVIGRARRQVAEANERADVSDLLAAAYGAFFTRGKRGYSHD